MTTIKRRRNMSIVSSKLLKISLASKEDRALALLAEDRLKAEGDKLTHDKVWSEV